MLESDLFFFIYGVIQWSQEMLAGESLGILKKYVFVYLVIGMLKGKVKMVASVCLSNP